MEVLIDFVVLIVIYIMVFYKKWRARGRDVLLVNTMMYIYLSFVLYFTLMPIIASLPFMFDHPYIPMNMAPFVDVAAGRGNYTEQVFLNIVMTIPFGILLPLMSRRPKFWQVVLYTFGLSLAIELVQPLLGSRTSDITDLITNVLDGAIGYGIYVVARPVIEMVLKRVKEK